jgi:hypothetical protein
VKTEPERPSQRVKLPLAADLEAVLLRGLAKKPADRFASAQDFAEALGACAAAGTWTARQADAWWTAHNAGGTATQPMVAGPNVSTASVGELPTMELAK